MEQIIQQISQMLQQGIDPQQVLQQLVQAGIPQDQAQQAIQQVMSQGQEQPMMQLGGLKGFNPKPTYNMSNADWTDSATYRRNFYDTPDLAMMPSRSPSNTTFGINYSPDGSAYNNSDLEWQLYSGIPYTAINSDNPSVVKRVIDERSAYEDYQNQFKNYIQSQAKKAPKLQKFLNKTTPFKFQNGGQFQPNGYDAIHPSMYNQMQQMYNQNFVPQPLSQEQMSMQLAQQDQQAQMEMANYIAKQRRKLGKKALPKDMYNFVEKNLMNTPEIKRLVNPNTILANQTYNMGGTTYSKRKLKKCK
jgi:hypothetical protein